MAFIPAPNCVEVVIRGVWAAQIVSITLSFCGVNAIDEAAMDTLAGVVENWLATDIRNWMSNDISFDNINITDLGTATSMSKDYPISPVIVGASTDNSVPNNVALVTQFKTDQRGRSYRGRVFTPGMIAAQLVDSVTMGGTVVAGLTSDYAQLAADALTNDWQHVVISRYTAGAPRVTAVSTPITSYSTEQFLDSQRRRLAGRGQ